MWSPGCQLYHRLDRNIELQSPFTRPYQEDASTVCVDNVYWRPRGLRTVFTRGSSQAWNVLGHVYITDCRKILPYIFPYQYKTTGINL